MEAKHCRISYKNLRHSEVPFGAALGQGKCDLLVVLTAHVELFESIAELLHLRGSGWGEQMGT